MLLLSVTKRFLHWYMEITVNDQTGIQKVAFILPKVIFRDGDWTMLFRNPIYNKRSMGLDALIDSISCKFWA